MLARLALLHRHSFPLPAMSRPFSFNVAPPVHRGMTVLNKEVFQTSVPVLAAKVEPHNAGKITGAKETSRYLTDISRQKHVLPLEDGNRLVLLRAQQEADLPPETLQYLKDLSAEFVMHIVHLDYNHWSTEDILSAVLPEELIEKAPSGFAAIGHIAHLNLKAEYLPYKHLIGQVILDKNKEIKTVVNKLDTIDNQFRIFKMELLAGEPNYIVEHHESNSKFTFDFSEVYWNSRLHTEHSRLVDLLKPEDVLADVFAGVGPFSIPAARKGCGVIANDLNPSSYKYLVKNIQDNKVGDLVVASCEDGREFIRGVFNSAWDVPLPPVPLPKPSKRQLKAQRHSREQERLALGQLPRSLEPAFEPKTPGPKRRRITHVAMNLPGSAIEFLDAFRGVLAPANAGSRCLSGLYDAPDKLPLIHCYCFTREREYEQAAADIRQRVQEKIGHTFGEESEVSAHWVRSVAPAKEMYCITFRLPYEVAFAN